MCTLLCVLEYAGADLGRVGCQEPNLKTYTERIYLILVGCRSLADDSVLVTAYTSKLQMSSTQARVS